MNSSESNTSDSVQLTVDILYKQQFGKMVSSLLHFSRDIDPETAEDIVQDSFSSALTNWRLKGIPANQTGWIYQVCRNKALNLLKKNKRIDPLSEIAVQESVESLMNESLIEDEQLSMLFACAHPDLSPRTQLAITLKYVVNLHVDTIANIMGMNLDAVDKLLLRARKKIRDERLLLAEPPKETIHERLAIVHKIIYCTFNEGYKSSGGKEIIREQLCEDALLLNRALLDSPFSNEETKALYALMLFNAARFEARFSDKGELLDLENQDRRLWNQDLIFLANRYLTESRSKISTYHIEAAIACVHCKTSKFELTNWELIAGLYARLLHMRPNPFVELNYAIALYYAGNIKNAFSILNELLQHAFLSRYYLLSMALGKFHLLEGNHPLALEFLLKAHRQTNSIVEKDFIQRMIDRIEIIPSGKYLTNESQDFH